MSDYRSFRVCFRGYDREEVTAALQKLASENSEAWREIDRMGSEIEQLQRAMAEQLENERHVQTALITAAKVADEIRINAEEEARRILREAEQRGDATLEQLRSQARVIEGQIDALLARRRDAETAIETLVKGLARELEDTREQKIVAVAEDPANDRDLRAVTETVRFGYR